MPRSDPLILDRETREPLPQCLPASAERHEPWKVIVLDPETQKRKSKKFFSYVEAKQAAEALKEKYGITMQVGVVSRQTGYGPPYSKVKDQQIQEQNEMGNWWCPYCRRFRRFLYNAWRQKRLCEFCRTTETDFHVKKCNPVLWMRREDMEE